MKIDVGYLWLLYHITKSVTLIVSQSVHLGIKPPVGPMTICYICRFCLLQLYLDWGAHSHERMSLSFISHLVRNWQFIICSYISSNSYNLQIIFHNVTLCTRLHISPGFGKQSMPKATTVLGLMNFSGQSVS